MKYILLALMIFSLMFSAYGCRKMEESSETSSSVYAVKQDYKIITQQEAKRMIDTEKDIIILDVRRQDEYDTEHIPNAVLIPNESIIDTRPAELDDLNQKILIYCRSGNRSKQAAQKLADMGYTNIYEFGGIITWEYDTVKPSALKSPEDISLRDTDGNGKNYLFTYNGEDYKALYTNDKWKIINSYKITDTDDIEIICEALKNVHPIHNADYSGYRTAEDMAYEWQQHNLAYPLIPSDSAWKESARDVDINPQDQGKSLYELFYDRIK